LPKLDTIVSDFEAVSGAILNRNRKSVLVGLGTWAGRLDWPLPWLVAAPTVKIFGIVLAPTFAETLRLSWDRVAIKFEATLHMWTARRLPTLALRRNALEIFGFTQLYYLAQILPLPSTVHRRIRAAAGAFLWRGRFERLAWDELHVPPAQGGLGLTCVASRAQALLAKQACHRIAAGGHPAAHIAYWLGHRLRHRLPALAAGPHTEVIPPQYQDLGRLLLEVFHLDGVETEHLEAAKNRGENACHWLVSYLATSPNRRSPAAGGRHHVLPSAQHPSPSLQAAQDGPGGGGGLSPL
jgi:hypothetical protein